MGDGALGKKGTAVVVAAVVVIVALACILGCKLLGQKQIAATVGGESIYEEDVTAYVEQFRSYGGYAEDADWANYLNEAGTDAEGFRKTAINALAEPIIIQQKANELGIEVTSEEVDETIANARKEAGSVYVADDDLWETYLSQYGFTPDQYTEQITQQLLQGKICQQEVDNTDATDDEVLAYINAKTSTLDGTESTYLCSESYEAIFYLHEYLKDLDGDVEDMLGLIATLESTDAKDLPERLQTAKSYLSDNSIDGACVWDCVTTMDDWYTEITDGMKPGELYDAVADDTQGMFYIIYCNDKYKVPVKGFKTLKAARKSMPKTLYEQTASYATVNKYNSACSAYIQQLKESADLQVNSMPSGLSYDVKPAAADSDDESGDAGTEG